MALEGNPSRPIGLVSALFRQSTSKIQLGPPCWHFGPRCLENWTAIFESKRFRKENKMAAELSTLVSSFLESKPETYAPFFLECVDSKQHLGEEVSKYHNPLCGFMFRLFSFLYHV